MGMVGYFGSSIGKKQVMGITGLVWYLFLFVHLAGNTGLFAGPKVFNSYSHFLLTNLWPVVVGAETIFLLCLVIHVFLAILVSLQNRAARPVRYVRFKSAATNKGNLEGSSLVSRSMIYGGIGLSVFLAIHVLSFKFDVGAAAPTVTINGVAMRDIHALVMSSFSNIYYTAACSAAFILLAAHLWHGVQSSVQSAGLYHPRYVPLVRLVSRCYALVIGCGFCGIAVWAYLRGGAGL